MVKLISFLDGIDSLFPIFFRASLMYLEVIFFRSRPTNERDEGPVPVSLKHSFQNKCEYEYDKGTNE
ncbi:hypothetical protein GCM10027286_18910 [Virgibacillus ainsalahensis]